jgi:formylglycine-generating enzyme required for sulfatase activity
MDETQHEVTLAEGFWMGETQVTQGLWKEVMGSNPSANKAGDDYPVEMVSWDDCQEFLNKLNDVSGLNGSDIEFRLPTSDEWEHACRAGGTGDYCRLADGTDVLSGTLYRVAWFSDNAGDTTHPVGQLEANAWGLHDMHGNVGEWTQTADGANRKERGGSWRLPADFLKSSGWGPEPSWSQRDNIGFRLCASDRAD